MFCINLVYIVLQHVLAFFKIPSFRCCKMLKEGLSRATNKMFHIYVVGLNFVNVKQLIVLYVITCLQLYYIA